MSSLIQVDYAPEGEFSNCRRIHFRADIPKQKAGPLMLPQKTECRSDARYLPALCFFAFGAAMRGLQCPAAACFCAAARRGRTRDSGAGRLFVKWERKFCLELARCVRRIETLCRAGGGEQLQLIRRQLVRVGERAGADHLSQRVVRGGKRCISAARPRSFSMSNAMV